MRPRLTVLLGAGGAGKTTLAAALALALAARGRRTGLLGIDPAKRLHSALGLPPLPEQPIAVAGAAGSLSAALLLPGESLRRWVREAAGEGEQERPADESPFFAALADRLAGASETIAAIRAAEWAELDPSLDELVIDTAPGREGLEFLARPDKLISLLEGRLFQWLAELAVAGDDDGGPPRLLSRAARRLLAPLSKMSGTAALGRLATLCASLRRASGPALRRLDTARRWIKSGPTRLLVVAHPRADGAGDALGIVRALDALRLWPTAVLLNRALPRDLPSRLDASGPPPHGAGPLFAYARSLLLAQERAEEALSELDAPLAAVPLTRALDADGGARLRSLTELGEAALRALEPSDQHPPHAGDRKGRER